MEEEEELTGVIRPESPNLEEVEEELTGVIGCEHGVTKSGRRWRSSSPELRIPSAPTPSPCPSSLPPPPRHTHRAKELIHAAAGSFGEETAWRNEGAGVGATV
jgi:hypothetical protein